MAESNLPATGEEPGVKNEFPATGKKGQQGKTSLFILFVDYVYLNSGVQFF